MKCPYCDENIDDSVKVCPICGEKISIYARILNTVKKVSIKVKNKNVSFCSKNKFVILCLSIIVLIACVIASYTGFEAYSTYMNDPTYNSIVAHEDYGYYNYPDSAINVMNKVIDQNNDLIALVNSRVPQKKKEIVFNTYLSNMVFYNVVKFLMAISRVLNLIQNISYLKLQCLKVNGGKGISYCGLIMTI